MTEQVPSILGLGASHQRIAAIPASQSLRASEARVAATGLPTGLKRLDEILVPTSSAREAAQSSQSGGIPRGHVTEIFGPPGVGKTAMSVSTAVRALHRGERVLWIDTGSPIPVTRVREMLTAVIQNEGEAELSSADVEKQVEECMGRLLYFRAPQLPHLLALLLHPPASFPPEGTSLLIIDTVSAPFPSYFPNATELASKMAQGRIANNQQLQRLLNRRWNVTGDLANHLVKLATGHNMAVLLVNQTHTKIKGQHRATLYPMVSGGPWENSIHARIVLYRDWWPPSTLSSSTTALPGEAETPARKVRFAEVMKRGGKALTVRSDDNVVPFWIETTGFREIPIVKGHVMAHPQPHGDGSSIAANRHSPTPSTAAVGVPPRKRKVAEIADSEDEEDYGWLEGADSDIHPGSGDEAPSVQDQKHDEGAPVSIDGD